MQADITPEALENWSFSVRMRGYDPEEVDALLAHVAAQLRDYKDAAERAYQVVGEEMGELLQQARDRADAMVAAAEKEAADILAVARVEAESERGEAAAETERVRSEAQSEAEELRARAEEEGAQTRSSAADEAERMRREAAAAAVEMRTAAQRDADERMARADERVRRLKEKEKIALEHVTALRVQLLDLVTKLEMLEAESPIARDESEVMPVAMGTDRKVRLEPPPENAAEATP